MIAKQEKGPVVYVVQEPRYKDPAGGWKKINLLPALDYGSIEVLLEPGEQVMFNAASVVRTLKAKLAGYREQDFILAGGDPVAIGISCAIAALANRGRFTVLKWDRQESRYFPVLVNILEIAS